MKMMGLSRSSTIVADRVGLSTCIFAPLHSAKDIVSIPQPEKHCNLLEIILKESISYQLLYLLQL